MAFHGFMSSAENIFISFTPTHLKFACIYSHFSHLHGGGTDICPVYNTAQNMIMGSPVKYRKRLRVSAHSRSPYTSWCYVFTDFINQHFGLWLTDLSPAEILQRCCWFCLNVDWNKSETTDCTDTRANRCLFVHLIKVYYFYAFIFQANVPME